MGSCLSADVRSSHFHSSSSGSSMLRKQRKSARKKDVCSVDSFIEDSLHRVPGRIFLNGSSDVASLFTQKGKKRINQDAMIVWENFGSRPDTVLCGVFDGHGPYGHMVAKRVRDSLPLKIRSHWDINTSINSTVNSSAAGSRNSDETSSFSIEEVSGFSMDFDLKDNHPELFVTLREALLKAFKIVDKDLKVLPTVDCFSSGTTAVMLVKQGEDIVIGNVGDSRAVLGTRDKDDSITAVQLTVDLKPSVPREAERIRRHKGRIFALEDEPDVVRVWLPNDDAPGLAMARAFGDFCLKDFGLISVPDVSYHHITERDVFIVLATDGVWDVLSNQEVVKIVASAPSRSSAAKVLVESAIHRWKYQYPTSAIDDCAAICLFVDSKSSISTVDISKTNELQPMDTEINQGPLILADLNRSSTLRCYPEIHQKD